MVDDNALSQGLTLQLLRSWRGGDRAALDELVQRHLPWIRDYVRRRLGARIREKHESMDLVQDAVLDVLRYGPRFEVSDEDAFRGLLARIVENNIKDRRKWFERACRDQQRERSRFSDSVLALDPPRASVTNPAKRVAENERVEWVRLALELLDPGDRELILWREFDELSFREIAERLGCNENAARMRFQRALPRLAVKVAALKAGRVRRLLDEGDAAPSDEGAAAPPDESED